jgi:predicted O-methyltransferase YrrM
MVGVAPDVDPHNRFAARSAQDRIDHRRRDEPRGRPGIRYGAPMIRLLHRRRGTDDLGEMTSREELAKLSQLASEVVDGCVLEIGSYRGKSAIALAAGVQRGGHDTPVYAVDPHEPFIGVNGGEFGPEDRGAFYRAMLDTGAYRVVRLVNLPGNVVARAWQLPVGMLFIDGDHAYEAVHDDLHSWLNHLTSTAIVAFDDIQNEGPARVVQEAVEQGLLEQVEQVGKVVITRRIT